ncbi:alpha/beta fold hydrolase [Nonomuraea typhae]|uniref:Alpha/beta fold hydrolase n=1 Tax=Nonomuraea typhae TaxID=2603600 RepID=A0ABW7Z0T1_9ACTN
MVREVMAAALLVASSFSAQAPLRWGPCAADTAGMECTDLQVPVDWSKPDGRTITLKLGRLPATGRSEGSLLVAYGGPGGPGVAMTQHSAASWAELRKRMDIVTWDTRGYGKQWGGLSTELPCVWMKPPTPGFPGDDAEFGRLSHTNREVGRACQYRDPVFFGSMSSADMAHDMEAIRKTLGEPALNYYGASYAGLYGQTYARLYPDRVRTMVLDGTWSHATTGAAWERYLLADAAINESFLGRFFAWCKKDASCAQVGPDLPRAWSNLMERADRTPIPARSAGVHYDARELRAGGLWLVYQGRSAWPKLGEAIRNAQAGDASGFVVSERHPYLGMPTGVTDCLDHPRAGSRAEIDTMIAKFRRVAPHTREPSLFRNLLGCVGWPVPVTNPPKPLPGGLPPFLGAGAWRESELVKPVLDQVPGSGLITHDGPGHTLYLSNECARIHINRYVTDRVVPENATC